MIARIAANAAGCTAVVFSFIIVGNFTNRMVANATMWWWDNLT